MKYFILCSTGDFEGNGPQKLTNPTMTKRNCFRYNFLKSKNYLNKNIR